MQAFAIEEEAAAWSFVQHRGHLLPQLLAVQTDYAPLLAVQRYARALGAPLLAVQQVQQPARQQQQAQQAAQQQQQAQQVQQPAQQPPQQQHTVGTGPLVLRQLMDANPLPAAPEPPAAEAAGNAAPQRTAPQNLNRRIGLHGRRGLAAVATLTAEQLLLETLLLPVLRHCLLGMSAEAACRLLDALAAAAGLPPWLRCHLDHIRALALQDVQAGQLSRGLTLHNLRPLLPAVNVSIGSGGLSLVQGRAGQPPLCRRLPGGQQLASLEESRRVRWLHAQGRSVRAC